MKVLLGKCDLLFEDDINFSEKVEEFLLSTGLRIQQKLLDICYTSILNYK